MDLDFTKWSSYGLIKFYLYAEAASIGLPGGGPLGKWSDAEAENNLTALLRATENELRRRGDYDRFEKFLEDAEERLFAIGWQVENLFTELWPKSGGKVVRLGAYVEGGDQRSE